MKDVIVKITYPDGIAKEYHFCYDSKGSADEAAEDFIEKQAEAAKNLGLNIEIEKLGGNN